MSEVLDAEQERLLVALVEAALGVPRAQREFLLLRTWQEAGALVARGGLSEKLPVLEADLNDFEKAGLIDRPQYTAVGSYPFTLTKKAYAYVEALQHGERFIEVDLPAINPPPQDTPGHAGWIESHQGLINVLGIVLASLIGIAAVVVAIIAL